MEASPVRLSHLPAARLTEGPTPSTSRDPCPLLPQVALPGRSLRPAPRRRAQLLPSGKPHLITTHPSLPSQAPATPLGGCAGENWAEVGVPHWRPPRVWDSLSYKGVWVSQGLSASNWVQGWGWPARQGGKGRGGRMRGGAGGAALPRGPRGAEPEPHAVMEQLGSRSPLDT